MQITAPTTESRQAAARPSPRRDENSAAFFDAAKRGVLMIQHCNACGTNHLTDGIFCPNCLNIEQPLVWKEASGKGKIDTFSVVHQSPLPGFAGDLPFPAALVRLDEGPQLPARIVDTPPAEMKIGMAVKVKFVDNAGGEPTPVFARA